MQKEHFKIIVSELAEPKFDPELDHRGKPRKNRPIGECNDTIPPVLVIKAIAHPCEWCERICTKEKTYSRSPGSNLWRGKCNECGERRQIHTSEINTR
jgi:hypothetical protein